jgi:hypothetical protein
VVRDTGYQTTLRRRGPRWWPLRIADRMISSVRRHS